MKWYGIKTIHGIVLEHYFSHLSLLPWMSPRLLIVSHKALLNKFPSFGLPYSLSSDSPLFYPTTMVDESHYTPPLNLPPKESTHHPPPSHGSLHFPFLPKAVNKLV